MKKMLQTVRWIARVTSLMLLLFWGFFIVAHFLGGNEAPARPLTARDCVSIAAMLGSLAGLAVAWRREFAGGTMTLAAVLLGTVVNWRVLLFPSTLIPLNALLFLFCWWRSRKDLPPQTALPATGS